jgi:putative oxidoreductase
MNHSLDQVRSYQARKSVMSTFFESVVAFAGRIFLSAIFIASGLHKLSAWQQTLDQMESHGVPSPSVLLVVATTFELAGGVGVLLGCWTRVASVLLIAFLIPVTYYFHDFWTLSGAERQSEMINFMKNTAILGGLCYVLANGSGSIGVDRYIRGRVQRLKARHD